MKRKLALGGLVVLVAVVFLYSFFGSSPFSSGSTSGFGTLTGYVVLDSGLKVSTEKLDSSLVQAIQEGDLSPRVVVLLDSSGTSVDGAEQSVVTTLDSAFDVAVEGDAEESIVDAVEPGSAHKKEDVDVTVTHAFDSVSALSMDVTSPDALLALTQNKKVQKILLDYPINLSLDDSVPLTASPRVWNLSSGVAFGNRTITGVGNSVCVIDTGVDYTHSALGTCHIVTYNLTGNITNYSLESSHPYSNSFDYTWNISHEGYSSIAVHFQDISLESQSSGDTADRVYVYDGNNNTVAVYKGSMSDVWTPHVDGDTMYVRLVTDQSTTAFGFSIDSVLNGTTNSTLHWENCSVVIGGYDTFNGDSDPMDDHGHGTHVAGIIASQNDTYRGVAPGAKVVALKALSAHGGGYSSDVLSAIEWCNSNAARLNITVISMSLGCDGSGCPHYGGYCDNDILSGVINESVAKNISVFIAAGNSGWTDGISNPSCIENAIPIGGETMNRTVVFNRGGVLHIIAPGINVRSPVPGESWATWSGTSMATPHAAGVALLMQQYSQEVYGRRLDPYEIESRLESTSAYVFDNASLRNYTLLDAYGATIPRVHVANITQAVSGLNFSVGVHAEEAIMNVSLLLGMGNASVSLEPIASNDTDFEFEYMFNNSGLAWYEVTYFDPASNRFTSANYSMAVDTQSLGVVLSSPVNGSFFNSELMLEGVAALHNLTVVDISLVGPFINGSLVNGSNVSGGIVNRSIYSMVSNATQNVTISSVVNTTFVHDGNYSVFLDFWDDELNLSIERDIIIDHMAPQLTNVGVMVNQNNVTFNVTVNDLALDTVTLYVMNSTSQGTNYSLQLGSDDEYGISFISVPGQYNYSIIAKDTAGNENSTSGNYSILSPETAITIMRPLENASIQVEDTISVDLYINESINYEEYYNYTIDWGDNTSVLRSANTTTIQEVKSYAQVGNKTIFIEVNSNGTIHNATRHIFVVDTTAPEFDMVIQNPLHIVQGQGLLFNVTDRSAIDSVSTRIDNRSVEVQCESSTLTFWRCGFPLPLVDAGNYTFSFVGRDVFSNENESHVLITIQTCTDGVQNGDEVGSDCGGSCAACPTSTPVAIQQAAAVPVLSESTPVQNVSSPTSIINLTDDSTVASSRSATQQSLLYVLVLVIALLIFLYAALYRP